MQGVLARLDAIFKEYKSSLEENLEKLIIRNNLDLDIEDVKREFDVEYEVLSLDTSTIIDSVEKSELVERLRHIESLVKKVVENVISGYPHKIRVSLKLKTILAEYSMRNLKNLLATIARELRGAKNLESGWRVLADLILDSEDGIYLTVEIDVYVYSSSELF